MRRLAPRPPPMPIQNGHSPPRQSRPPGISGGMPASKATGGPGTQPARALKQATCDQCDDDVLRRLRLASLLPSAGLGSLLVRHSECGENPMARRRRRLLQSGTRRPPRVLQSALGPGKPSEDDLLRAYRSISFDMGPGREGGRLYEGRSGKRVVIFGVDTDRSDPSGDGEVI